jgi:hypothetical protein
MITQHERLSTTLRAAGQAARGSVVADGARGSTSRQAMIGAFVVHSTMCGADPVVRYRTGPNDAR